MAQVSCKRSRDDDRVDQPSDGLIPSVNGLGTKGSTSVDPVAGAQAEKGEGEELEDGEESEPNKSGGGASDHSARPGSSTRFGADEGGPGRTKRRRTDELHAPASPKAIPTMRKCSPSRSHTRSQLGVPSQDQMGSSPYSPPPPSADLESEGSGDADGEDADADADGEIDEEVVVASMSLATEPTAVHERPSPGTIDGLDPRQLQKLHARYRDFATELKRKGDRRLRDPEAASSVEEQERSIVEQTDALLLFVFSYVCLDRASAVAQAQGIGKEKIHSDQWKSMAPLLDYLKDRAHRKGLEVPWALCCLAEAVMCHKLASAGRSRLLKESLPSKTGATKSTANGVATTKDSPESASTSTSSSDHAANSGAAAKMVSDGYHSFLEVANWETRSQKAFSDASSLLSTYFVRAHLPDTARLCADLESRTDEAPSWLPHSPWWFCWPLNPYDCASDVCGLGRSVLEEYAGERLGLEFPGVELFIE